MENDFESPEDELYETEEIRLKIIKGKKDEFLILLKILKQIQCELKYTDDHMYFPLSRSQFELLPKFMELVPIPSIDSVNYLFYEFYMPDQQKKELNENIGSRIYRDYNAEEDLDFSSKRYPHFYKDAMFNEIQRFLMEKTEVGIKQIRNKIDTESNGKHYFGELPDKKLVQSEMDELIGDLIDFIGYKPKVRNIDRFDRAIKLYYEEKKPLPLDGFPDYVKDYFNVVFFNRFEEEREFDYYGDSYNSKMDNKMEIKYIVRLKEKLMSKYSQLNDKDCNLLIGYAFSLMGFRNTEKEHNLIQKSEKWVSYLIRSIREKKAIYKK